MSKRPTDASERCSFFRLLFALGALAAAFCGLASEVRAQGRPLIAWSTDRANPERLGGGANSHTDIWVMDSLGQGARRLTDDEGDEGGPSWSPDGKRIAFHHSKFVDGFWRDGISIMDSDGGPWTPVTQHPDGGGMPSWSPTGNQIAFLSSRDGNAEIYVINVDGSGVRNLTRNAARDWYPTWSPDGSQIAFASGRATGGIKSDIYVMDADGGNVRPVAEGKWGGMAPTWSPDGSEIAYWGGGGAGATLIVPAAGGVPRRMTETMEGDSHPAWSPNGRQIAVEKWGVDHGIWVFDMDTEETTRLTADQAFDRSPDWFDPAAPRLGDLSVRAFLRSLTPWARLKTP